MVVLLKKFYYSALAIWPFVFIREDNYSIQLLNHESVHLAQQKECFIFGAILGGALSFIFGNAQFMWLVLLPYYIYVLEYFAKLLYYRNRRAAYRAVSFEREAIAAEPIIGYLSYRRNFTWLKFIFMKKKGGKIVQIKK